MSHLVCISVSVLNRNSRLPQRSVSTTSICTRTITNLTVLIVVSLNRAIVKIVLSVRSLLRSSKVILKSILVHELLARVHLVLLLLTQRLRSLFPLVDRSCSLVESRRLFNNLALLFLVVESDWKNMLLTQLRVIFRVRFSPHDITSDLFLRLSFNNSSVDFLLLEHLWLIIINFSIVFQLL